MPEDLRVLVVTSALVPSQMQTWRAASEQPGIDLHLVGSMRPDPSESYLAPLGVPDWGTTHVLPPVGLSRRGRLWWRLAGLDALIARLVPDVVHVHSEVWGCLVTQAIGAGRPTVAHGAENVSLSHGGRVEARIRTLVARQNAERLAGYASWNRQGVDIVRRHGLPPGAPTAVAPAIVPDPEPYLAVVPAVSEPEPQPPVRIGYLGRLVPEKGVHWLIGSLAGLSGAQLVVIGSGPYEDELRRHAARHHIPTQWRGVTDAEDLPGVLAGLDIVVVPSITRPGWAEQFGRVVCEAMLTGVPVVSSDSGSLPEVVGDAGVIVPELDHRRLRDALERLVRDPTERARLGERGRQWALAELVPDAAAGRLAGLWREVAAS